MSEIKIKMFAIVEPTYLPYSAVKYNNSNTVLGGGGIKLILE